ncbi:MAG: DUF6334 family protein [Pseudomonadota bacterium]
MTISSKHHHMQSREMLKFNYEEVAHTNITDVLASRPKAMNDGSLGCEMVVIRAGQFFIIISVNIDTDEIVVELAKNEDEFNGNLRIRELEEQLVDISTTIQIVGKKLGWAWEAKNYRGYEDCLLLALGDVVPDALSPALGFISGGSSISLFEISPVRV